MLPKCKKRVDHMQYEIEVMQRQISDIYLLVGRLISGMEDDEDV